MAQEPSAGSQTFHSGTLSDDDSGTGDTVSDCADVQESVSEEEISSDPELDPGLSGTTAAGMNSRELHHKNEHLISVKGAKKQKFLAKRRVKKTGRKSILLPKRLSKAMRRTREYSDEEDIGISLTDEDRSGSRSRAMKLDSMFLDSLDCSSKSEGEKAQVAIHSVLCRGVGNQCSCKRCLHGSISSSSTLEKEKETEKPSWSEGKEKVSRTGFQK